MPPITSKDAANRIPVVVQRPGRPDSFGRLVAITGPNARGGGPGRIGRGRAKVLLPSGSYITVPADSVSRRPDPR